MFLFLPTIVQAMSSLNPVKFTYWSVPPSKCFINHSPEGVCHRIIATWHTNKEHRNVLSFLIYTMCRDDSHFISWDIVTPHQIVCFVALMFSVTIAELFFSTVCLKNICGGSLCSFTITLPTNISQKEAKGVPIALYWKKDGKSKWSFCHSYF